MAAATPPKVLQTSIFTSLSELTKGHEHPEGSTEPCPRPVSTAADTVIAIVLNWWLPKCTPFVLETASYVVVADGGANRLYSEVPDSLGELPASRVRDRFIPGSIVGDLDSIKPEVRQFYHGKGVPIHDRSEDQDTNDLTKCINACLKYITDKSLRRDEVTIVCLGALGGRLDHTFGNINVLLSFQDVNLVLLGDGNLTRLVPAGRHIIKPDLRLEGPECGLIPLVGAVKATTTGLKWNLDDLEMVFGGIVSTSNIIEGDSISVDSNGPLLWTCSFRDKVCPLCGAVLKAK